jgi:Calpain family cysteine protease
MPPKPEKKKTARGKDLLLEPQIDYTRLPLQLESASNAIAAEAKSELIHSLTLGCTHEHSAEAIAKEDWGLHGDTIFTDDTLALPEAAQWVRAKELVKQRPAAVEAAVVAAAGGKGKPKPAKEAAAKPKAKAKGAATTTTVADKQEDDEGLLLPRVVLSADSDAANNSAAPLPKPDRAVLNTVTAQSESVRSTALASVFTAINSLATTVSACSGTPFLWEAIHPQDSSGRPCYNPAGKYTVQLWAAGAWRSVTVDDRVPLTAAGAQLLPCTADSRELWPLLLSKALLKLHALLPQPSASTAAAAAAAIPAAQATAQLAAFCMSALTGWGTAAAPLSSLQSAADVAGDAPQLLMSAFELPELSTAGAAEEKSREKEEDRLRRQALFLHKRRRPKRIERHTATVEEVSAGTLLYAAVHGALCF